MKVTIHDKSYNVNNNEFNILPLNFYPMKIRADVPELDREISFLKEIGTNRVLVDYGSKYGYYVGKSLVNFYDKVISIKKYVPVGIDINKTILRIEKGVEIPEDIIDDFAFIICDENIDIDDFMRLKFHDRYLYINSSHWEWFRKEYDSFLDGNNFNYDNLINLLIMVKNAGDNFRNILEKNLPYVDHWTFLDTGSTDNTVEIIKDVMKCKRGTLYQEPFINFRDSRNRLFDLAGEKCAFNIMLDDTYVLHGDLRKFLTLARGDDVASSFNLFITTNDMMYGSIRITKPERKKRYVYTIHEIVNDKGFQIPKNIAYIEDIISPYMNLRTKKRKEQDLVLLTQELKDNPDDARTYYYMAETYLCMENWKKAAEWYKKRAELKGYIEEKQDSLYKYAVMHHLHFNTEWKYCHELYLKAYRFDTNRPEGLFMIGYHYCTEDKCDELAYMYLRAAFELGNVIPKSGMNLNVEMYNKNIPKYLIPLCYKYKNWKLGFEATERMNNYYQNPINDRWRSIMYLLLTSSNEQIQYKLDDPRKVVVFVAPGGWKQWSGETLRTRGLGGSETCVIRFAENIAHNYGDEYKMIVFCNCGDTKEYKNVIYIPINQYAKFIATNNVYVAFINRYPEYLHVTIDNNIPCNLVLHDLVRQTDIIPVHPLLRKIICLSKWHINQVLTYFPVFSDRITTLSYGIEVNEFPQLTKIPYSFIYSSFPNRGLHRLLTLWPHIVKKFPQAHLNVFCDTKHSWVREFANQEMNEIEQMLQENKETVTNHGWVNKETLKKYWATTHVWFYPTLFEETCCLTAYEAAASKTVIVSSDIAALKESVGDRGLIISGIPGTKEWNEKALDSINTILTNPDVPKDYINRNYEWAKNKRYDIVVSDFVQRFIRQ